MAQVPETPAAAALTLLLLAPGAAPSQDPFARCEERLAARPEERESAACFYRAARETGLWEVAWQRLRAHLERAPERPWLHYYLGNVGWGDRRPQVAGHYREAARLLAQKERRAEEVEARLNLAAYVRILGKLDDAEAELEEARGAAAAANDAVLRNRVDIELARLLLDSGRELGRSYRLLRAVEDDAFPDGDYVVQRDCLAALGTITFLLGRFDDATRYRRRYVELSGDAGDRYAEASALHDLAITELVSAETDAERAAVVALLAQALDAAVAAGNRTIEARAHSLLGRLAGKDAGVAHLQRCVDITRAMGADRLLSVCLRGLAAEIAADEPERAERILDEALALGLETRDPWALVYAFGDRKEVIWASRPPEEATRDALQTLQPIEALRSLQSSADDRIAFLSAWADAYYWLAGRLLAEESPPSPESVEQAFGLAERIRARGLLEILAEEKRRDAVDPEAGARHDEELRKIVALNRRLLSAELSPDERRTVVEELGRHERAERALRLDTADAEQRAAPTFAELAEVEDRLGEDQAMLSFQLAEWTDIYGDFAGGSWLLVSTRAGTTAYRLPPPSELEPAVEIFRGLVGRRQGLENDAAVGLYERLLAPAIEGLPGGVEELLVIPDGALHRLPFAALRPAPDASPLGMRYRITHVPSATLWLQWQESPAPARPRAALVLADPSFPTTREQHEELPAVERAWSLAMGARLGPLPHARREGRAVARRLAGETELLEGAEASEERIKSLDLSRFGLLHFAAHAVVDDEWPERSAVLLAAGAPDEDGLLQAREIVELELDGQLVVLSACRSGGGAVLRGEGAMSLARAFFAGGAHAALASLWPLRDDEAASLVEELYRELSTGATVSAALSAAARSLAARNEPTAAWAGLVLLGNGELQPVAARESGLTPAWITGPLLVLAAAALVWRRRRSRHASRRA